MLNLDNKDNSMANKQVSMPLNKDNSMANKQASRPLNKDNSMANKQVSRPLNKDNSMANKQVSRPLNRDNSMVIKQVSRPLNKIQTALSKLDKAMDSNKLLSLRLCLDLELSKETITRLLALINLITQASTTRLMQLQAIPTFKLS